ncbi:GTP-binding protein [Neobacillus sp. LXY-4]|uniref:GTP-binding protein n=1 Tax=Neobacillus sp. LXY-4 TaxID=3379826 RepID=UPI003EE4228A
MPEEQFLKKIYYETYMDSSENRHPVEVLGEIYIKEQQNDLADLSYIRFAQGEIYYHSKDFETAIFKWENIKNELEPWAKKNMADAYYELELFSNAENIYKSIDSDSTTLKTEVLIQLFSLYIQEGKLGDAVQMIKQAVALNPDYPTVTQLAKLFFEEQQDWENSLELAVNEAVRTEELQWFDTVIGYVDRGYTKSVEPSYFLQVITALGKIDGRRFEKLITALWKGYKQGDYYFNWLTEFNRLFESIEITKGQSWFDLSGQFRETYLHLLDGNYLIKEISEVIPSLISNWLKIAEKEDLLFSASAILAWNELFPASIPNEIVSDAEQIMSKSGESKIKIDDSIKLFESICRWAEGQDILVSPKLRWIVEKLADLSTRYLLVTGDAGNGKKAFFHSLIGEPTIESRVSNVLYTNDDSAETFEMTDTEMVKVPFLNKELNFSQDVDRSKWSEVRLPSVFLRETKISVIHSTNVNEECLNMADGLVFLVNEKMVFSENERILFMEIQKSKPDLPVHFLLLTHGEVPQASKESLQSMISSYFPTAKVFTYSLRESSWGELQELGDFFTGTIKEQGIEEERSSRVLSFIKYLIGQLLEKRVELENNLLDSVNWNKQMVGKLTGAINQLNDVQSDTIRLIKKSYQKEKEDIRYEVIEAIPKLLRECSSLVKEDSDFRKIHLELNEEMNVRIEKYIMETALPKFQASLQMWVDASSEEFKRIQASLTELATGFNAMFDEERLDLECDFKVLDDWSRDVFRMTSSVNLEKVNILLRMTPAQVLLKSAGKLLGAITQNKKMLCSKYKQFIESEDYVEIAQSIASKLLQQFELFEKGLERDISMFFTTPDMVLQQLVTDTNATIFANQTQLNEMGVSPERFNDPLTLFQIRLRQYEWIMLVGNELQYREIG